MSDLAYGASLENGFLLNLVSTANECKRYTSLASRAFGKSDDDLVEIRQTFDYFLQQLVPYLSCDVDSDIFDLSTASLRDQIHDIFHLLQGAAWRTKDILASQRHQLELVEGDWEVFKAAIFQADFVFKQKVDQFSFLFPPDCSSSPGPSAISDPVARQAWCDALGSTATVVPWGHFFPSMCSAYAKDEDMLKFFLDFCHDGYVSIYEFSLFVTWFGPYQGCYKRMLAAVKAGLLGGSIAASHAANALHDQPPGSFIIRYSKSQPGSYAVTFVDEKRQLKHCLLHSARPNGVTLGDPPDIFESLNSFAHAHSAKLKFPLAKLLLPPAFASAAPDEDDMITHGVSSPDDKREACIVCLDHSIDTVFLECGHMACCQECSKKIDDICPICRGRITRVIRVYKCI